MTSKVIKIKEDIVKIDDKYYEKQKSSDYLCGTLVACDDCSLNKFSDDLIGELCDDCEEDEFYVDIIEDVWERSIFGQDEEYVDLSPEEVEQQLKDALGLPKKSTNPLDVQIGGGHYKEKGIQPVQYIHANGLDFFEGNAIKYLTRWRTKGGLKDLEKAKHYIDLLIELEGLRDD
jgi:Protein of unknwon function (DUF3310)